MGPEFTEELKALRRRYLAGLRAVKKGADPWITLYHVIWPTKEVEEASRGDLPSGWRFLSSTELWQRERQVRREKWARQKRIAA